MYTDEVASIEKEELVSIRREHDLEHMKDEDEDEKDTLVMLIETLGDVLVIKIINISNSHFLSYKLINKRSSVVRTCLLFCYQGRYDINKLITRKSISILLEKYSRFLIAIDLLFCVNMHQQLIF